MAGSSKKASPKSPKKARQGKAAASETESASKCPKRIRQRKGKATVSETGSDDFNNEDYNIRSLERTNLLTKIKGVINNAPISPALWACCQLADMNRLQTIVKADRDMILGYENPLALIAVQWTQRFRDSDFPGSEAASRPEGPKRRKLNSDGQSSVSRSTKEADNCKARDDYRCALTKQLHPQAAHIFPYSMLKPRAKGGQRKTSDMIPDFWNLLRLFWDRDQIEKWKRTDSQNPEVGVESCFNLISLSPTAHDMWNRGLFALKPLKLSRDRKKLTVQFFWQVPGKYDMNSRINLLTEPTSSEGLDIIANGYWLTRLENDGSTPRIRSGETFTFTTKDPKNLPLPSLELLEMQWVLQRLVGMCGAAGWPSLDLDDDYVDDNDDSWLIPDYADFNVHNSLKRVRGWVGAEEAAGITPETSAAAPGPSVIPCY